MKKPVWQSKAWWGAVTLGALTIYNATAPALGWPVAPDDLWGLPVALGIWGIRDALRKLPGA